MRPSVPVAYENVPFDPPDVGVESNESNEWVRISILPGQTTQASLASSRRWRTTGVVVVQCFIAKGIDNELALQLADDVVTAFRGAVAGVVTLMAPSIQRVGPRGSWYELNVTTPFRYDVLD